MRYPHPVTDHQDYITSMAAAAVQSLSRVQTLATPWTVAHQVPLSMGFPRQDYWSG